MIDTICFPSISTKSKLFPSYVFSNLSIQLEIRFMMNALLESLQLKLLLFTYRWSIFFFHLLGKLSFSFPKLLFSNFPHFFLLLLFDPLLLCLDICIVILVLFPICLQSFFFLFFCLLNFAIEFLNPPLVFKNFLFRNWFM